MLDESTAEFIQSSVMMNIATTNASNMALVARAYGCNVAPDRRWLMVIVNRQHNQGLLDNIEHNHKIAAVFSRPSTHQTVQIKSSDAQIVPLTAQDIAVHERYKQIMCVELMSIAYPLSFADAMMRSIDDNSVGIRFSPQQAFTQTPGPNAGKKLSNDSAA